MNDDNRYIWLNRELVKVTDARVNVLAPTAQFGANVFEGMRCYYNTDRKKLYVFRLEDHFQRLKKSLKLFRITCPYPEDEWFEYIRNVVHKNLYKEDIAIRMTVFVDGFGNWASMSPTGMFIAPVTRHRKAVPLEDGISGCVSTWRRISDSNISPHIKVGANYINSRYAQIEAEQNGYGTAIFLNEQGRVAEGPGSCLFIVKDGRLISPPLTASVLDSITRATLISLAEDMDICSEIREIDRTELYIADEVFLCGSAAEITPIVSIDGHEISGGSVGEITRELHKKYIKAVTGEDEKHLEWITEIK